MGRMKPGATVGPGSDGRTAAEPPGFEKIFAFDKGIRFCGLVDKQGGLIVGRMRENLRPLEPEEEDPRLFLQIAMATAMDRTWDRHFGKTKCIVIAKERVNIFIFSLADLQSIVIATEPTLSVSKMRRLGEIVDTTDLGPSTGTR